MRLWPLRILLVLCAALLSRPVLAQTWRTESTFDASAALGSVVFADVARDRFLSLNTYGDPFSFPIPRYDVFAFPMTGSSGWSPLAVEGIAPPYTSSPRFAHDPGRDRVLLVDDFDPEHAGVEVVALELAPVPAWRRLTPAGTPPYPRVNASLTYDPIGDRLLLFGGRIGLEPVNELWELRFTPNLEWRRVETAGLTAPALESAPMTFDAPHQRLVVVQPPRDSPGPGTPAMAWTLDVSGDLPAWDVQVPTGPQPPVHTMGTEAVRDSSRNILVISTHGLVDSWGLRLSPQLDWIQFGPVGPVKPNNADGTLAFDERRIRLFSFNGASAVIRFGFDDPIPGYTNVRVPGARGPNSPGTLAFDPFQRSAIVQTSTASQRLVRQGGGWAWEPPLPLGHGSLELVGSSWDSRANRALRFESKVPSLAVYAIDPDSTKPWVLVPTSGGQPGTRQEAATAYDSTTGTTYLFGGSSSLSDLWAFRMNGNTGTWTSVAASGGPVGYGASMVLDPVRRKLVVFGGATGAGAHAQLYWFDLVSGSWNGPLVAAGTPPAPRAGAAAAYDPIRDRMIIQGGRSGSTVRKDAFALQFGPSSLTWVPLGSIPDPAVAPALGFFDNVADAFVVIGERFQVLPFDTAPALAVDVPTTIPGAPASTITIPLTVRGGPGGSLTCAYDVTAERDWPGLPRSGSFQLVAVPNTTLDLRVAVPDSAAQGVNRLHVIVSALDGSGAADTATVAIDVTALPAPVLACGGDVTWTPGTVAMLVYTIDNASPAAGPVTYRLTLDRAWPGLPIEGTANLSGYGSALLPLAVPVPDTVAAGAVVAHLVVAPAAFLSAKDECFRHLHDATTPTLLSVIESELSPDGSVRLTWWGAAAASSELTIERRPEGGSFAVVGTAHGDAGGFVVFEDRGVPGGRYAYRAGRTNGAGMEWSPEFWVTIPAARLAFAGGPAAVRRGALDVEFTAPSGTPVMLEAFDVRGRRVASRRVDEVTPGRNVVRLSAPNNSPSGVYFLRLTQADRRVTGRIILLTSSP
jgi:hypothetical protein